MTNRDLFLAYIEAYNELNVARMLASFDETCVFENVSGGEVTARADGKGQLEELATRAARAFSSRHQEVLSVFEANDRLCAEIEFRGSLQSDLTQDLKAGMRLHLRGVSIVQFQAGKIVRLTDYS